jgi:hypothetical protein
MVRPGTTGEGAEELGASRTHPALRPTSQACGVFPKYADRHSPRQPWGWAL